MSQGDVVTAINRQPVNSADDVRRIQSTLRPGQPVAFRVMRAAQARAGRVDWQPLFLAGTLPEKP
jgi:serine protease Do